VPVAAPGNHERVQLTPQHQKATPTCPAVAYLLSYRRA
jgi:hypothetical protein